MEKEKRRKQKLDEGRRDPESVINELMEGVDFDKATKEDAESRLLWSTPFDHNLFSL